jgi:hypothetical protein
MEISERSLIAEGHSFGDVGPYERIRGRLVYAVTPDNPRNAVVVDLNLASTGQLRRDLSRIEGKDIIEVIGGDARNDAGEVEFTGDFLLFKPVDLSKGNHRLLYDVNNRGFPRMVEFFNDGKSSNDPVTLEEMGNGWLMRQGYSLLWSGWNWDVERVGESPLRINLPIIVQPDGKPMTGLVNAELDVQVDDETRVERLAWGGSRCYPLAEGYASQAVLTVRDQPDSSKPAAREVIPRERWKFARLDESGKPVFSPVHIHLPDGFRRGRLYELIYTAVNPRVVGLGLAAIRDAISFFRFETQDASGVPNPLASHGEPDSEYAYIFGISQSGRVIAHMIFQGFHVDEQNRMVFDGARPHVPGGGKGGFNFRWAQTTHHPKHLEGNYFPADFMPFLYAEDGVEQFDPYGQEGRHYGDLLRAAKALGKVPKILVANHALEYWTRSASLLHTNVQGTADLTLNPNVRVYMINGARHGSPGEGGSRNSSGAEHSVGQIDQRPVGRALLVALDRWVSQGIVPPPSRVPRIDRHELISAREHQAGFPKIPRYELGGVIFPASRHPGRNLMPPRLDYGPRFWTEGIQDRVPPVPFGPPYETRVPAYDSDGNGIGGIRLPDLEAPLGTYQGFNPRKTGTGTDDFLTPFESSFWPFAPNRADRLKNGDTRLSVEERYPARETYLERVRESARALQDQGFLLSEDAQQIIEFSEQLVWPPLPTKGFPFWATRD